MRLDEITGDERFDKMMGGITGSDTPSVDLSNRQTTPDEEILKLTHKIFLRLRDYDDPEIFNKFIKFMVKTVSDNVGSLDEERNIQPGRKGPSVGFKGAFDHVKQAITNASLDIPPYNTPEFRIDRINEAIRALERIRNMLESDSTIAKASRK